MGIDKRIFIIITSMVVVFGGIGFAGGDASGSMADKQKPAEKKEQKEEGQKKAEGLDGIIAIGTNLVMVGDDFKFTEGPACDATGNVYFTDIPANRIYKWTTDGKLTVFREDSGGANGLFFDKNNNLLACQGNEGRVVSMNPEGVVTVLADKYEDKKFNKPNDLWIDPNGGIYFTDPAYGMKPVQEGENVYYMRGKGNVIRVIDDMVRPNGLIGTADGKILYVTDHGGKKTFKYEIEEDGRLVNKQLFAPIGSDGMTIDEHGNIYLTEEAVFIYDAAGKKLGEIPVPARPSNVCFGGENGNLLFITARTYVFYIPTLTKGVKEIHKPAEGENKKEEGGNSF